MFTESVASTSRNKEVIEKVYQIVTEDHCLTLREIEEVRISRGLVYSILTEDLYMQRVSEDLYMQRVSAKFVPKLLMEQQKELLVEIAQNMLDCANNDLEFTQSIITGDETRVYGYDQESKFHSSQWKHPKSPRVKKAWQVHSNVKVMMTCFFNSCSIVHHEGQTINKEYYLEVLRHLHDAVLRKGPDMWTEKN